MKKKRSKYIISVMILLIAIGFCYWQNNDIVISDYEYKNSKIPDTFNEYKIVQISDLHNKEFGKNQKRLLAKVKHENPDIIVVTGDLVDSNHTNIDDAMNFIKGAVKIAPVYYVTGNHELWLADEVYNRLKQQMVDEEVMILEDEILEIENKDGDLIQLIGLDDDSLQDNTLKEITTMLSLDKLTILLAHEPQYISKYSLYNIDFIFSGHAHGGQFRLPFIRGLVAPDQGFFPEYTSGIYRENNTEMVVSRGLGNSVIPVRIFNRPQIVTVTLKNN